MALYTNVYSTLKGLDQNNTQAIVAAAAQAFGWSADGIARFCARIQASPSEVDTIIRTGRASKDAGAPWFVQP